MPMTSAVFEIFQLFSRNFSTSQARSADSLNSRRVPASEVAPDEGAGAPGAAGRRVYAVGFDDIGEIGDVDYFPFGHDDHALDRIAQLADIAAPPVALHHVHRGRRHLLGPSIVFASELIQEVLDE